VKLKLKIKEKNKLNKCPVGNLDPAHAPYPGPNCELKLKKSLHGSKITMSNFKKMHASLFKNSEVSFWLF